jgi:hypothetical protein
MSLGSGTSAVSLPSSNVTRIWNKCCTLEEGRLQHLSQILVTLEEGRLTALVPDPSDMRGGKATPLVPDPSDIRGGKATPLVLQGRVLTLGSICH